MSQPLDLEERWQRYKNHGALRCASAASAARAHLVLLTVDFAEKAVKRYGADEAARRILV
jgi:hypothetical protein